MKERNKFCVLYRHLYRLNSIICDNNNNIFSLIVTIESENFYFNSFLVTAERDCHSTISEDCGDPSSPDRSGSIQLPSSVDSATFHPECINTIIESEPDVKLQKLRFVWSAPKTGSGCVYLRYLIDIDLLIVIHHLLQY